jgi:hypothetical protein
MEEGLHFLKSAPILNSTRNICRCHVAMIGIVYASKFFAFAQETGCRNLYLARERG